MTVATPSRWWAVAMIVAAVLAAAASAWNNSATNDEPYHTLAGYLYVRDGHADLNPEHPPLTKLLAGAPLQLLELRGTALGPVKRLDRLSEEVRAFLYFNIVPAQTILRLARLPMLLFLPVLLAGVWLWARHAWGEWGGLVALLAVACQPLVLGHAGVVHTDVAAAATWVWTGYLLHRWVEGSRRAFVGVGAAVGVALLTKFSATLLVLAVVHVVGLWVLRSRRWLELLRLVGSGAVALAVLIAGMWPAVRNVSVDEEDATIEAYMALWPGGAARVEHLETLAAFSVPLAHWSLGLAYVKETNEHGQGINFLFGRTSTKGFKAYFPVAFALKTSLPFLLLVLWGAAMAVRRRDRLGIVLLAVVSGYFVVSLSASYNIGARHLMPILPLAALLLAQPVAAWPHRARLAVVAALLASPVVAFPHYIAHFSLLAGGAEHGARLLTDSNVDWGQDWRRVGLLSSARGWTPMSYVYLGSGYPARDVPGARDALDAATPPESGFVAVSRYAKTVGVPYLAARRAPEEARRLERILSELERRGRLVAVVGHSIEVYRLEAPAPGPPG